MQLTTEVGIAIKHESARMSKEQKDIFEESMEMYQDLVDIGAIEQDKYRVDPIGLNPKNIKLASFFTYKI